MSVPQLSSDPRGVESAFRQHLRWAMVWPLVAFLVAAGLLLALVFYVQDLNRWVDHTDVVIGRATLVERLVVDTESRLRSYLISGDPQFLEFYRDADGRLPAALETLQTLVRDSPPQVARLQSMRAALARWRQYAEQQLERSRAGAIAQDIPFYILDGEAVSNDIRSRLREIIEFEEALRVGRVERADAVTRWVFLAGLGFVLVLGPALALTTAHQMRRSRERYREALEAQERMARSLLESEEDLRLAKDAAQMGSWHWNLLSGELVWSERCKELFGLKPDTSMSYDVFLQAVHPDDRDRIDRAVQDALAKRVAYDVQMMVPWHDGSFRWVAARGEAVYDDTGRAARMAGMALDVTAQKRAEDALRESDRRKDDFLGMLSHELRNPLAPIRNAVHVLGRVAPASPQAERARVIIARQVDHLARLVDDLLDVKRISTGKLRLRTELMDLSQQVRETMEDMRPLFMNRTLSLHVQLPDQTVWVKGDRTRLAQVLSNLLHNAAKFTDAGGHVSVAVDVHDGRARIRVRDDGVGVAPEMLENLFDAFVQSDRTLHRTRGGLGLGLSLVRGITELHGGTVVARSEGAGKGTEFVVTLPVAQQVPAAHADGPVVPVSGEKRRVLIIEDNVDAAESLRDVIEVAGGHEVLVANDGEAGVAAARQHAPDVILCDIGLPGIDGYEVARRIRAGDPGSRARLIALSGYASADDIDRAIRSGFDYHIPKPAAIHEVLERVVNAPSAGARAVPADLATGHPEVDAQHATMLEQMAHLRSASPEQAWESLRFLQRHATAHFRYEETLMQEVGYRDLAAHEQQHAEFLGRLRALQAQLERDGATLDNLSVLVDTVEAWVIEHVLGQDRRVTEFIRSRAPEARGEPVGAAPAEVQGRHAFATSDRAAHVK